MQNFIYDIPTRVYFGKGQIKNLPEAIERYGKKVLLVYGGGSIKRSGLYDTIVELLKKNNIEFWELGGVEPNPRVSTVREGVKLCKEHGIEVLLPVGGGSSIDCAKGIAAGAFYDGDAWDLVIDWSKIKKALPIVVVLTLAATGSEMDTDGVITNLDTNQKLDISSTLLVPKASILDPEYTYTVPKKQTAAGSADILSHIMEVYFSHESGIYFQSRVAEALMKTVVHYAPIAMEEPDNYEARANLMWSGSWAINGLLSYGRSDAWSVHPMEHELSAFYDITHGAGLAILTPHWMKYILNDRTVDRFVEFGVNVWGVDPSLEKYEIANKAIEAYEHFVFDELGLPRTLREVGIDDKNFEIMAKKAAAVHMDKAYEPFTWEDVVAVYKASL